MGANRVSTRVQEIKEYRGVALGTGFGFYSYTNRPNEQSMQAWYTTYVPTHVPVNYTDRISTHDTQLMYLLMYRLEEEQKAQAWYIMYLLVYQTRRRTEHTTHVHDLLHDSCTHSCTA